MPEPRIASKQMIEQMFDGAAASYNRTGPNIFTTFGKRLVELMPLAPGDRVLDVATGTGAALFPAAHRVEPDGHVTGIDLSGKILMEAENAARGLGLDNVELRKMDAEHLDFRDQTFDAVICALGIFLFPDLDAAMREMHRVCKADGHIGVSVFGLPPVPFDPGMTVFYQQAMEYEAGVQMPQQPAYTEDQAEAVLSRSGFRSITACSETYEFVYASEEEWWGFLLTVGPSPTITGMDEETRSRFKEEYFTMLRPLFSQDGLHVSVAVTYATGQR